MTLLTMGHLVSQAAPWLSGLFAVLAAVFAERAFSLSSNAAPPEPIYHNPNDIGEEIRKVSVRDVARLQAGAAQSTSTFLAAAAATEAAAATQVDVPAAVLVLVGVGLATFRPIRRWLRTRHESAYVRADALYHAFQLKNKLLFTIPGLRPQGIAAFIEAHPGEAETIGLSSESTPEPEVLEIPEPS